MKTRLEDWQVWCKNDLTSNNKLPVFSYVTIVNTVKSIYERDKREKFERKKERENLVIEKINNLKETMKLNLLLCPVHTCHMASKVNYKFSAVFSKV